jgi:hypothetical protein
MAPMSCVIMFVLFRVQLSRLNPIQTRLPSVEC